MTNEERKVMELALKACQNIVNSLATQDDEGMIEHAQQMIDARDAITAIKELLAQPEQEPVAWVRRHPDGAFTAEFLENAVIEPVRKKSGAWFPLYTTPPQRTEQEPVAFEEWLSKQHGDPEEIGFLQALRIAYISGQDSITTPPKRKPLTDEDIKQITNNSYSPYDCVDNHLYKPLPTTLRSKT